MRKREREVSGLCSVCACGCWLYLPLVLSVCLSVPLSALLIMVWSLPHSLYEDWALLTVSAQVVRDR